MGWLFSFVFSARGWRWATFQLAVALNQLDHASNLNESIWVWLIPQGFSAIVILVVSNHTYCDLVGPFLQPAFRPCFLGCGSNRICLENSIEGEVSLHLHPCIIVGVLSHSWYLTSLSDFWKSHQSSLTIFSSTWCHIKGGPCFYFVVWCVSIGTRRWCIENNLWNWRSTIVLSGWS